MERITTRKYQRPDIPAEHKPPPTLNHRKYDQPGYPTGITFDGPLPGFLPPEMPNTSAAALNFAREFHSAMRVVAPAFAKAFQEALVKEGEDVAPEAVRKVVVKKAAPRKVVKKKVSATRKKAK